ncbi:hypothetical protein B0H17DRAFT_1198212 [Mycena rosella]|uniref:Uncharacterized protein n=1 Tax=Mycena rosella TaxID=1033263 RepID=A0AAD7DNZ9_MYCRO|nr:hypothetical protein B0H17DRAFT_1198212 [Mycena rosella]
MPQKRPGHARADANQHDQQYSSTSGRLVRCVATDGVRRSHIQRVPSSSSPSPMGEPRVIPTPLSTHRLRELLFLTNGTLDLFIAIEGDKTFPFPRIISLINISQQYIAPLQMRLRRNSVALLGKYRPCYSVTRGRGVLYVYGASSWQSVSPRDFCHQRLPVVYIFPYDPLEARYRQCTSFVNTGRVTLYRTDAM